MDGTAPGLEAAGAGYRPGMSNWGWCLGLLETLRKVYPEPRPQRCWVHKIATILNKLPKAVQPKAKSDLHQIWLAETREAAEAACAAFVTKYGAKYEKAVDCLEKDRELLLTFYDFPAEHWAHIRMTNPIESTFATIRLRTAKPRGCISRQTALALVYKLSRCAEESWRKLQGFNRLGQVIQGVQFVNGVRGGATGEPTCRLTPQLRPPLLTLAHRIHTSFIHISPKSKTFGLS